jgi:hypothetical protein
MSKIIMPQGDRKFWVYENQAPGKFLLLDFSNFGMDKGVIVHWQSKPEPYREWGLYDATKDSYTSAPDYSIAPGLSTQPLTLPDGWGYVPSAVMYFPDAEVVIAEDGSVSIGPASVVQPQAEVEAANSYQI